MTEISGNVTRFPRKRYETPEDRETEDRVARWLCKEWGCSERKLPDAHNLDRLLLDGKRIVAAVEIKGRRRTLTQYPDIFANLHKVIAAHHFTTTTCLPVFYVVLCTDALVFCDLNARVWKYEWRGRTDRNDPDDEEPCALIPLEHFRPVKGSEPPWRPGLAFPE